MARATTGHHRIVIITPITTIIITIPTRMCISRVLPPHIHIDAGNRVRIRVESDKPYLRHNEHVRVYKSEPNYRVDVERSRKEREANQRWYQEYQKQTPKGRKKKERY
jgi:hypothetical protein